jgi:hypothetical protein
VALSVPYIDTTFERDGTTIKTVAKVYGGWDSTKKTGCQFYDQQFLDYKGDITLRVAVWMSGACALIYRGPDRSYDYSQLFPLDFSANFDDGRLQAAIVRGRVSISLTLQPQLPWIVTSNGKPAINWGPEIIAEYRGIVYQLRHMIVINLPVSKRGDYKEWDLLPFLPGGLIERNRQRH